MNGSTSLFVQSMPDQMIEAWHSRTGLRKRPSAVPRDQLSPSRRSRLLAILFPTFSLTPRLFRASTAISPSRPQPRRFDVPPPIDRPSLHRGIAASSTFPFLGLEAFNRSCNHQKKGRYYCYKLFLHISPRQSALRPSDRPSHWLCSLG